MKKPLIFATIILVTLTTLVVSCKKDETPSNSTKNTTSKSFYQPPQVDDMDAYLEAFKQRMQARGNNETMDLDEAAWHLSSVANYDFGDVVDDFANIHYDTLRYNINVDNGRVGVSDLSALYTVAASDIESNFENLDLDNKHIRFIGADISGDGTVIMSILVTYDWVDHQWYFNDPFELYEILSQYYSEDSIYYISTTFPRELKRVLDILSGHPINCSGQTYYTIDRNTSFMYSNYTDPYGSDYYEHSRIFAKISPGTTVTLDDMFYLTDSYLGLGHSVLVGIEVIIDWSISGLCYDPIHGYYVAYHVPSINIGTPHTHEPKPGGENH